MKLKVFLIITIMYIPFKINTEVSTVSSSKTSSKIESDKLVFQKRQEQTYYCNSDEDCSNNGKCNISQGKCYCNEGYITFLDLEDVVANSNTKTIDNKFNKRITFCNYEKKDQLTAFLLSLFVGFTGAEHFYLENIDKGITKLIFSIFCCLGNIIIFVIYKFFPEDKKHLVSFVGLYEGIYLGCGFFFMVLWMIYDLVKIGKMEYVDGNGIEMNPW